MTREEYNSKVYVGKHEPKQYFVWRVLGPAGPEQRFTVTGLKAAREAIYGCWDAEVTDINGKDVTKTVMYS